MAPSVDSLTQPPLANTIKSSRPHPFAPLTSDEITYAAQLTRDQWPAGTDLQFKAITLEEPPKSDALAFLDAEHSGSTVQPPNRKAFVSYYLRRTNKAHECSVDLSTGRVEGNVRLGPSVHPPADGAEILAIEKTCLEDADVKAELAKLQLPQDAVIVCDPWIYGSDGVDDGERMFQCFLYTRDPANPAQADSNHYAHPLPVSPVIASDSLRVIRIDWLPTGADEKPKEPGPIKSYPANEYLPESQELRSGMKPLHVVQPEGASFTVTEQGTSQVISWQKWSMRVGFNQREGMVLYDVRYDGRQLFYRVALSDMNIPYADPRSPYHRKAAFDLGDVGAGVMANNLKLGCDCLGSIHYISATLSDDKGGCIDMPNVICVHEQDAGIGWKHTNYRTGRAALARQRELVLQTILTVANYEYILAFNFNQAAEMHYEVRATGILSTQPIDEDVAVPWGTVVHPGVLATHHQHIFSLRVDPMIEGQNNRLVYTEAHALPRDSVKNPHGTGYVAQETVIKRSGGFDQDWKSNRTFKIQNSAIRNPVNKMPIGYKIMAPPFQPMLADKDSYHYKRAEFADHNIYATSYRDDELYAGGKYTNQSRGGTGVRAWAERNDDIEDKDLVVFVQFGMNHIPRIEDFPVMPCEVMKVMFKPVNFFTKNPALDVPPSEQKFNQSVLLNDMYRQPNLEASVNGPARRTNGTNGCTNGVSEANGSNGCCS